VGDETNDINNSREALRAAEAALEYALEREKALVSDQRMRMAEMAHELRSPLTAIAGFAELTMNEQFGPIDNEKYRDYATRIHQASRMMLDIIEALSSESMDRGSSTSIPTGPVDAGKIINGIVDLFVDMADERGIDLKTNVADDFPLLDTNATRLNQILVNLVSNAIKFTPEGGTVEIQAHVDPESGAVILVVQDDGVGMSAQEMVKALEPYEQGSQDSPHGDTGTGLGLTIVDRLVREIGGDFEVSSEKGKGTVVRIRLAVTTSDETSAQTRDGFEPFRKSL